MLQKCCRMRLARAWTSNQMPRFRRHWTTEKVEDFPMSCNQPLKNRWCRPPDPCLWRHDWHRLGKVEKIWKPETSDQWPTVYIHVPAMVSHPVTNYFLRVASHVTICYLKPPSWAVGDPLIMGDSHLLLDHPQIMPWNWYTCRLAYLLRYLPTSINAL